MTKDRTYENVSRFSANLSQLRILIWAEKTLVFFSWKQVSRLDEIKIWTAAT